MICRNHCVLQYGSPNKDDQVELQKDGSYGWYLYDLQSTHGSFINKAKVKAQTYYRIKVGHMIKFGTSSRIYILQVSLLQNLPDFLTDLIIRVLMKIRKKKRKRL